MENVNLIDTFSEFKELKNIDRPTMMSVLEDVFRSMLTKRYGSADNFDIIVNIDKGDFEIWRNREVVEDEEFVDPNTQIPLSEAKKSTMIMKLVKKFQMRLNSSTSEEGPSCHFVRT